MKCLIVEDEFVSRYMLKEILPLSFVIDIAVNGEEAVESFRMAHVSERPYNLIFMDVELPVVGGIEALFHIREMEREMNIPPESEVKVIMTTVYDDDKTIFASFEKGGASSYIVKPVDRKKLFPVLCQLGFVDD